MKAKTKFMRMYYKLSKEARKELIYGFVKHPMTMNVVALEVKYDTKIGKEILEKLGYENEREICV